ncbi:MAG: hypothetical protein WC966_08080 [Bradymonadales bacterium]
MKNRLLMVLCSVFCILFASTALAQSFDSVEACSSLETAVKKATKISEGLSALLVDENIVAKDYLAQLYEGSKILSQAGEAFFKASDDYESACRNALLQANAGGELMQLYEIYLQPLDYAQQFFVRAKAAAVSLKRQGDVDSLTQMSAEFQAASLKIIDMCKNDVGEANVSGCRALETRLIKIMP